jgi:ferredoxin-NADP reductase
MRAMKVTFDHSLPEAPHITTFYFKPDHAVDYTAGQYIELTIPHKDPDARGIKRWFTLSSSPTDELLSITTKITPVNGSTFKQALQNLTTGITLHMSEPMGDFVLPKLIQTPLIFVAGGIGLTPFHSIFSWLHAVNESRPIKFIYAVHSEDEIVFQQTFDKANIHATIVVTNPSAAWGGERGQVNAELILGLEKPADNTLVYLSGPEPMVEALVTDLKKSGLPKSQLVTDYFPGYTGI